MEQRVVITGVGVCSALGFGAEALFKGLIAGRSGVRKLPWPLPSHSEVRIGAPVAGFEAPLPIAVRPELRFGPVGQFALAAVRQALEDSGFRESEYEPDRVASVIGVSVGDLASLQSAVHAHDAGETLTDPGLLERIMPSFASDLVALEVGAQALSCCPMSACASSAHAIGQAFELIRRGAVDLAFTGGADTTLDPYGVCLFEKLGALSTYQGPAERASRPFDRDRDGFVLSEGAAILVLETLERARKRGARVYAEIAGYAATADAFHVTRPPDEGTGMAEAMASALREARVDPKRVQYVNAHGTGTEYNDVAETIALKRVFGAHAPRLWISSNKSMLGHALGAAAAIETVATVLTLVRGVVPPTINLDHPDSRCDLDYVPTLARERAVSVAVKNSFGFGGQNASLVLTAV